LFDDVKMQLQFQIHFNQWVRGNIIA